MIKGKSKYSCLMNDIKNDYNSGLSTCQISKKYNISRSYICLLLKKNGIQTRNRVRHFVNHDVFCDIDTKEKAYWLGMILADGCIHKNTFIISLHNKDRETLVNLNKFIESSYPIANANQNTQGRISIYSKKFTYNLKKHAIFKNKSFQLEFPYIREDLISHFVRRIF